MNTTTSLKSRELYEEITLSSTFTQSFTMADAMFMYEVTGGIFVFLTAILFGSRAKRLRSGSGSEHANKPEAA